MKIVSFQTYLKGDHPTISIGTLETSTGETTTRTLGLPEYDIEDGVVVYAESGKDRSPSYPADRYLKNADYLVRYTGSVLFSWLEDFDGKEKRILPEIQRKVLSFREFVGLGAGEHIPKVIFDDSEIEAELDLTLGVENGIRERFESLTDHLTDVDSGWEKGCLSLCMLAFSHRKRQALAEEAEAEKQRDKAAEREKEEQAVYKAVKAAQSAETKRRLDDL